MVNIFRRGACKLLRIVWFSSWRCLFAKRLGCYTCDGLVGYKGSDQAEEGLNYALMAFLSPISNSERLLSATITMYLKVEDHILKEHQVVSDLDDTITDYSMPSSTIESNSDDLQNKNSFVTKTGESSSGSWENMEKNNYTHKSRSPRIVFHKTDRFPTRTTRPNMNAAPRPNVNNARPKTTQDLMILLIQRIERLERELKARTPPIKIHKVDRGRSSAKITLYLKVEDPILKEHHPIPDLSFTGLDKFVNKPIVEKCKDKSSKEELKVVRKNDDDLIIQEWVSDNEEDDVSQPKNEKKIVRPSIAKIEFFKSKQQEKTTRKTIK
nr:hypothetical protein [Tanacetum cinerariifolium]